MSRSTQIIRFSVPPAMVREVESMAKQERRTKSELREMLRGYQHYRQQRERDENSWVMSIINEAKAEEAKNPMSMEELLAENDRLVRYGRQQAKKLGIKPKDINRLIQEYRKARRAQRGIGALT